MAARAAHPGDKVRSKGVSPTTVPVEAPTCLGKTVLAASLPRLPKPITDDSAGAFCASGRATASVACSSLDLGRRPSRRRRPRHQPGRKGPKTSKTGRSSNGAAGYSGKPRDWKTSTKGGRDRRDATNSRRTIGTSRNRAPRSAVGA